jgi:uncharacterized protein (UPF0179 family)
MKDLKYIFCVAIVATLIQGCASWNSGSVVSVMNDREAEVTVDRDFVKAGDKVDFYKAECNTPEPSKFRRCHGTKIGEGKVVSRIGDRAVVKADSPVELTSSTYVEWVYPEQSR